jgi:O-antigen ligase
MLKRIKIIKAITNYTFVVIIIAMTSAMAYRMAFYPGSSLAPLILAGILGLFILYRPIWGMAIYLIFYPMVPSSGELNVIKTAMLSLTILLFFIWAYQKIKERNLFDYISKYKHIYLLFLYLLFSLILGQLNGFSPMDWARDIASLLNLFLIPVFIDHLRYRKNNWLLYLVFVPLAIGVLQNAFLLLALYGIPFTEWIYKAPIKIISFHPSWIFGLGATLYLQKSPPRPFVWLYFAVSGLLVTFLTPGRTIWLSTIIMAGLMLFFLSKYRKQAILLIATAVLVMSIFIFRGMGETSYYQRQGKRVSEIIQYGKDLSVQNRLSETSQALELFLKSPLYGVGFGYQYHFWWYYVMQYQGSGYFDTNYIHNDIINILAKGGIIGLILFIYLNMGLYKELLKRKREQSNSITYGWAVAAIIILTSSLVTGLSTPIFQNRAAMFALFVILSTGLGYTPEKDK